RPPFVVVGKPVQAASQNLPLIRAADLPESGLREYEITNATPCPRPFMRVENPTATRPAPGAMRIPAGYLLTTFDIHAILVGTEDGHERSNRTGRAQTRDTLLCAGRIEPGYGGGTGG